MTALSSCVDRRKKGALAAELLAPLLRAFGAYGIIADRAARVGVDLGLDRESGFLVIDGTWIAPTRSAVHVGESNPFTFKP
jgi:hypothetical protein